MTMNKNIIWIVGAIIIVLLLINSGKKEGVPALFIQGITDIDANGISNLGDVSSANGCLANSLIINVDKAAALGSFGWIEYYNDAYFDIGTFSPAAQVKVTLNVNNCPGFNIASGSFITLHTEGSGSIDIYLPLINNDEIVVLYPTLSGETYLDSSLSTAACTIINGCAPPLAKPTVTRTIIPDDFAPLDLATIRYTFTGVSFPYAGILFESIPAGYTINSGSFINTMDTFTRKITGQDIEVSFSGITSGQYIEYAVQVDTTASLDFGRIDWSDTTTTNLPSASFNVCRSQASFSCVGDDVFWFDFCGVQETIKESCLWQCGAGACLQNTPADVNFDGLVDNAELLDYMQAWVFFAVSNAELLEAMNVWVVS